MKGKTVLITGASSGFGKACAERFAALGCNLVLVARRMERLQAIAQELTSKHGITCHTIQLDVRDAAAVAAALEGIDIDILVNNAGLALGTDKIQDAKIDNWETMIDTNLKGVLYVIKAVLPGMIKKNAGHIINIGSTAAHACYTGGNVYCATKHAVKAISRSLRCDLFGTALRVSEVDPGAAETEFSEVRWSDKERAKKFYEGFQPLVAEDIADVVVYCASCPAHVNISEVVMHPQAQASATDIYRPGSAPKDLFAPVSK